MPNEREKGERRPKDALKTETLGNFTKQTKVCELDADTLMVDINVIFGEHASPLLIKVRGMFEPSSALPLFRFLY